MLMIDPPPDRGYSSCPKMRNIVLSWLRFQQRVMLSKRILVFVATLAAVIVPREMENRAF
jgi:hypothetical protein